MKACSNCWICEGWTEVKFIWQPGVSSQTEHDKETPIYLHLSSANYKPELLLPNDKGEYSETLMVPPGGLRYFYSIGEAKIYDKS